MLEREGRGQTESGKEIVCLCLLLLLLLLLLAKGVVGKGTVSPRTNIHWWRGFSGSLARFSAEEPMTLLVVFMIQHRSHPTPDRTVGDSQRQRPLPSSRPEARPDPGQNRARLAVCAYQINGWMHRWMDAPLGFLSL